MTIIFIPWKLTKTSLRWVDLFFQKGGNSNKKSLVVVITCELVHFVSFLPIIFLRKPQIKWSGLFFWTSAWRVWDEGWWLSGLGQGWASNSWDWVPSRERRGPESEAPVAAMGSKHLIWPEELDSWPCIRKSQGKRQNGASGFQERGLLSPKTTWCGAWPALQGHLRLSSEQGSSWTLAPSLPPSLNAAAKG